MTGLSGSRLLRSWPAPGRIVAVAAIVLTVYGVVTLLLLGRADHLAEGAGIFAVFAAGFGTLAWLAFPLQPRNRALWVPAWASLVVGLGVAGWGSATLIAHNAGFDVSVASWERLTASDVPLGAALGYMLVVLAAAGGQFLMVTLWPLLFPDGKLPSPRWRWVVWATVGTMVLLAGFLGWSYRPGAMVRYDNKLDSLGGTEALVYFLYYVLAAWAAVCAGSLFLRQRANVGEVRQQFRWVIIGTLSLLAALFVVDSQPWQLTTALVLTSISIACYGVAVTKYRLYDIDVFISRTFVYGVLAAFIGAVYVVVVVVVGGVLGSGGGSLALAVVATALVAMAFEPMRRRAQRWANRFVYGKRATPYEVLADLTRRLAGTEAAQGILARMARLMAEGTGAEQATVWLADENQHLLAAAGWPKVPSPASADSSDALTGTFARVAHDGELVGVLEVVKARGNPVTPPERQLIHDLAGSAGLILGNQRLNAALVARAAELRQSRRRLVEMQDAERRRLERDLHDGAQQQVIALKLKIGLAEHVAAKTGAGDLASQLGELAGEAQTAVDEIRNLAKGIYPPLLESEDLTAAIRAQAAASPVPVEISGDGVGRYPRDVESAVYFAAIEGISNAIRHGESTHISITLGASSGQLTMEVSDDGVGFDMDHKLPGTGLINVRDRIEALGGDLVVTSDPEAGTTLSVRIPLDGSWDEAGGSLGVREAVAGLA